MRYLSLNTTSEILSMKSTQKYCIKNSPCEGGNNTQKKDTVIAVHTHKFNTHTSVQQFLKCTQFNKHT